MQVDKTTILDIGLLDNNESKGVASHLDFCKTNGGKAKWMQLITTPLDTKYAIETRQSVLQIFIAEQVFLDQMKISNGTCLVIDQFYGTGFTPIPKHISFTSAYWYQFWNKTDYALIAYSVQHILTFVKELDQWLKVFEAYSNNTALNALIVPIKQQIANLDCLSLNATTLKKDPQAVLQLGYFFYYQYKAQLKNLQHHFYLLDAYYSMATAIQEYQFTFPEWVDQSSPMIEFEGAVHPLILNAVGNDLNLTTESGFLFLTGANMAGKSTFIKTVGLLAYLAHIGMGVPAKKCKLSILDGLITNLTTSDNVLKGESYFFNEVQRIKHTLTQVMDGKKYLVLIDELFKGTNIIDAMKCSTKVIEGLQALKQSLCILSTHLYEISEPLKVYPHIQFYYFETSVIDKTLLFNYTLKKGVSEDRIGYLILEREGVVDLIERINT
ncbi:MAG: DNA mismatch repair protein MutS [Chitinophagia bacterium]